MRKVQIAIIDDGINEKLYNTGDLVHNIQITTEGHIVKRLGYDAYKPSHGTTCAAIIKKYSPDASLSSVKILGDESFTGTKTQLISALEWCADNKVDLINLSLGTINFREFKDIEKAVGYVSENGVVIVAACNNRNVFTCPASLSNVIGVKCDKLQILQERGYIYNLPAFDGIDITACGSHELNLYNGKSRITGGCNSFAAPAVTSTVYDIIRNKPGIGIYEIKEQLKEKSRDPNQIVVNDPKSSICFNNYVNKSIDIPIFILYNYGNNQYNELTKQLTQKFRANGYNAIAIGEEAEEDLCAGSVSIKSYVNDEKNNLRESINLIFNIYDPDIIIVSVDMIRDVEPSYLKDIESLFEVDIRINVHSNSTIEVTSPDETCSKNALTFNDKSIEDLYSYIINLYDR